MSRTQDANVAPPDTKLFSPGARRVHLNMGNGGNVGLLPPAEDYGNKEPNHTGIDDEEVFEDKEGF